MSNARFGLRTRTGQASNIFQNAPLIEDQDALNFVLAAGITDSNIIKAITKLVIDLKNYGLWTKMKAIYPFVGGTATTHKYNLKDPQDTDGAYRLVFSGGWTHSSNGATANGTNGYANTYLAATAMGLNSAHMSYYSRTNNDGSYVDMGATSSASSGNDFQIVCRSGDLNYSILNAKNPTPFAQNVSDGFSIVTRITSTGFAYFRNNSKTSVVKASDTRPSVNIYISARNTNNVAQFYSNRQCAFASIGDGLTDQEAADLYTSVQTFQTSLNRNV